MNEKISSAGILLKEYKGDNYSFGLNCLDSLGKYALKQGNSTLLVISQNKWAEDLRIKVKKILNTTGVRIIEEAPSCGENSPTEDVENLAGIIKRAKPDSIICVGGGSTIDCGKASNILASLRSSEDGIEPFFGVGKVSEKMKESAIKNLYPFIAVQTVSGSASHLTKYSNVTNLKTNQKKLIVDEAIIPSSSVFDYALTLSNSENLTKDGALDGLSHCLEVYYGVNENAADFKLTEEVCLTGIEIIIETLPKLLKEQDNLNHREAIGIATDLGGYAIMLYGTNGAHLNSFSFVDVLSHGRACAILNPYYTVFFAPAIENKLRKIGLLLHKYLRKDIFKLNGKELGIEIAEAMKDFERKCGFPTRLGEIKGFTYGHILRALEAAKNPQLKSKLENMPMPLKPEQIDEYMKPILDAAESGDFNLIKVLE